MSVVGRLEKLVALNPTTQQPGFTGSVGTTVVSREEATAMGGRVLEAIKNFSYDRLTVQNQNNETRITEGCAFFVYSGCTDKAQLNSNSIIPLLAFYTNRIKVSARIKGFR